MDNLALALMGTPVIGTQVVRQIPRADLGHSGGESDRYSNLNPDLHLDEYPGIISC